MGIERGSTRSHCTENWLWKRLWTCRKRLRTELINYIHSGRKKFCCRSASHVKCESDGIINHGCNCNSLRTISLKFSQRCSGKHCQVKLRDLASLRKHTSDWRWQSSTWLKLLCDEPWGQGVVLTDGKDIAQNGIKMKLIYCSSFNDAGRNCV